MRTDKLKSSGLRTFVCGLVSFPDTVVRSADLSPELKGHVLALLQEALLTPDVVQLVVNEPQQHVVAWTHNIDKHPPAVQERLVKIVSDPFQSL